jgi:NTE family protein
MLDRDPEPKARPAGPVALALGGGGARAAYQVGLLRYLGRRLPQTRFDIVTGVSAGAINATFLAAHPGPVGDAAEELSEIWNRLEPEDVFDADFGSLLRQVLGWGLRLVSGGRRLGPRVRGLVDTSPLAALLTRCLRAHDGEVPGIADNIARGRLRACAVTTLDYSTGQTVTWVQGSDIHGWERPNRRSAKTRMRVDHVLASSSLPLVFPAVRLGRDWHGDGGVRLAAPLSPALHLGARRMLAVSTRYARSGEEADQPTSTGYPPPAQILGHLMNAVFLDLLDQDVLRLELVNRLLERLPPDERLGMRPIEILALRPSVDLGRLAGEYEPRLPKAFRFLTRGLGTRETSSPDLLSLLMFQPDYLTRLIEIGEADAEARADDIARLLEAPSGEPGSPP